MPRHVGQPHVPTRGSPTPSGRCRADRSESLAAAVRHGCVGLAAFVEGWLGAVADVLAVVPPVIDGMPSIA